MGWSWLAVVIHQTRQRMRAMHWSRATVRAALLSAMSRTVRVGARLGDSQSASMASAGRATCTTVRVVTTGSGARGAVQQAAKLRRHGSIK